MEKEWIDFAEWQFMKDWYKQIESEIPDLHKSIMLSTNNLIKELTMSKRKYKGPKRPSKELIESVFELFKPNKVQLFFMKGLGIANQDFLIGSWLTGNKKRVKTLEEILKLSVGEIYELEIELYF